MSSINDLKDEVVEVGNPDEIPPQAPPPPPTPQPGAYEFCLPDNLSDAWEKLNAVIKEKPVERINYIFDAEHPLIISWPDGEYLGQRLDVRVSNAERSRGKNRPFVSDLFYLMRDGLGLAMKAAMRNSEWIALMNTKAGAFFGADLELTARCRKDADIRDGEGNVIEGRKGCGARYYQADIPRVSGIYQVRFTCGGVVEERDFTRGGELVQKPCGANLRAFPQLARFHPAKHSLRQA